MAVEYRVCWSASSNITFHGASDWEAWDDEDATAREVEDALYGGAMHCEGLSQVIEASGLDWHVETREAGEHEHGD